MFAGMNMTPQPAIPTMASLPAPLSKTSLQTGFAPCAAWVKKISAPLNNDYLTFTNPSAIAFSAILLILVSRSGCEESS